MKLSLGMEDSLLAPSPTEKEDGAKLRFVTAINIEKPYTSHIICIYTIIYTISIFGSLLDVFDREITVV